MNGRYSRLHEVETLQDSSSMADSTNWAFSSHSREVQQLSTATPLTSTGLPCLRTPRSMLRHAWMTALPRVRNEGSGFEPLRSTDITAGEASANSERLGDTPPISLCDHGLPATPDQTTPGPADAARCRALS